VWCEPDLPVSAARLRDCRDTNPERTQGDKRKGIAHWQSKAKKRAAASVGLPCQASGEGVYRYPVFTLYCE
jgi:hypothetical protein